MSSTRKAKQAEESRRRAARATSGGPFGARRLALVLVVLLPWGLVAWLLVRPGPAAPPPPAAVAAAGPPAAPAPGRPEPGWRQGAPGPWGVLERLEVKLEPPEANLTPESCRTQIAKWIFPHHTNRQVEGVLVSAGLTSSEREALLATMVCDGGGCVIDPPVASLLALGREARGVIYRYLSRYPHNGWALYGFRRRSENVARWFEGSGLTPPTQELLRRLMWNQGAIEVFSDLGAACSQVPTAEAKVRVVKALSRTPALMVRLHVDAATNLDQVAAYWDSDARRKRVRPILEAHATHPGGASLDIVHLLPPFARQRLYTYPAPNDPPWDCHWSSANFDLPEPSDRFLGGASFPGYVRANYREVPLDQRRFGDLLIYLRDEVLIHSAVFIADDIVFTKNGQTARAPWILMAMADVAQIYSLDRDVSVEVYRRR